MKLRFLSAALLALALLPGCAYYNTFFNTKKVYKEALEEHARRKEEKPSSTEVQKLDKTIEKASRLLQLHPDSKYVDDVLLMLGECFYYKQEYSKALRKFDELAANFPASSLAPRAQLWKAQTHMAREDFKSAEEALVELQNQRKKGEMYEQAQYYLGELYFRQEQYQKAAELYEQSAKRLEDDRTRAQAFMRLGESWFKLQQYGAATKAYAQAGKEGKDLDFKFKASLAYTRALKAEKRHDAAGRKLNGMLNEYSTHPDISWVKFELADGALQRGQVEEATAAFAAINTNYKRSEASAAAFYALGNIFQNHRHDYDKARENYDKVRTENSRSEYALHAQERAKALDDFSKLKNSIKLLELQSGSAAGSLAPKETANKNGKKSKNRNTSIRRYPSQQLALSNDPQKLQADLANQRLNLADLFHQQLGLPDSAVQIYREVISANGQTAAAPRALYTLALLWEEENPAATGARDSLLNLLAAQYANTPHGLAARRRLGLMPLAQQTETAENKFLQAEKVWLADKNPREAIRLYQEFIESKPSSDLQSKSLYAIGWIYEKELAEKKTAYETYQQLIEKFPGSPYSQKVRRKVSAFEQQLKAEAQAAAQPATAPAGAQAPAVAGEKLNDDLPVDETLRKRIEADRQDEIDDKPKPEEVKDELEEEGEGETENNPPDPE